MNKFLKNLWLLIILVSVNASAMNRVELSPQFFPNPLSDRAAAGARIYVGEPDLDPEIVANQKTVSALQEDGSIVALTQPVITGAGGIPSYNGSPITLLVDGAYSLKVETSTGTLLYYVPTNAIDGTPSVQTFNLDSLRAIGLSPSDGDSVLVGCHTTVAGGGGGVFVWNSTSTTADNDSIVVQQTGISTGRWIRQFQGPIHSSWFGIGQAGIQAMLDYATAHTSMVIDPGTYTISSQITTTLPGYNTISAYGAYFVCTHDGLVFDFNDTDVAQTPMFRWFGGRFENTNATKTASIAMYFQEWRNVVVADARFERFWKAIEAVDRDTFIFRDCHFFSNSYSISFDNTLSAGAFGDLILGVYNCHFSIPNCVAGIYADGIIGELNIVGSSFNGTSVTGTDIWIRNTGNASGMRGCSISNNHFEQGVSGQKYVWFDDTATGAPYRGLTISGNAFNDNGPDALTVESIWGLDITGNTFSQSSSTPVNIDANCLDINIGANGWSTGAVNFSCPRSEISMFPYISSENNVAVTGYAGSSFSTSSATIDMSTAISTIFPANIVPKGYNVVLQARDSASSTTSTCRVDVSKNNTIASQQRLMCRVGDSSNDNLQCVSGYVPCDSNGDIYINILASGANTTDIWLTITGIVY